MPEPGASETRLPGPLADLLHPAAYPHPVRGIELVQTHMSWILLTGDYAYKIKRPVHYPFADFRDAQRRAELCAEEIRLNRRFAPQLYLGLSPIRLHEGRASFGEASEQIECAVRMRQFDRGDELDVLVQAAAIEPSLFADFGRELAAIHARLDAPPVPDTRAAAESIGATLRSNLDECEAIAGPQRTRTRLRQLRGPLHRRLRGAQLWLQQRAGHGRIRECHGDLHLSNLLRLEGRIVPFDALEFDPALRWIDVADEVAFLCADLEGYAQPGLATAFLNGYLEASGDFALLEELDLYIAHRALVRAKVMAIRCEGAADEAARARWRQRHRDYLDVAARALGRPAPRLVLMHGLSGSGKTWLARRLAAALHAVHVRSDVERKRLAGLDALARSASAPGGQLYSPDSSAQTYQRLAECANHALAGRRTVIVDAAFLLAGQRGLLAELARRTHHAISLVRCAAPDSTLRQRLQQREAQGGDASEADARILDWQQQKVEAPSRAEGLRIIDVDTTRESALDDALQQLR